MAQSLLDYFALPQHRQLLKELHELGLQWETEAPAAARGVLRGKTFVITGTLPTMGRKEATALIEQHGGRVSGSISAKTSYLLAGEDPGSKLSKAQSLNVPVLTEEALAAMLKTT
jgi:DNA ligase (NAD+)